jgi:phage terminase large subunit
VADIDVWLPTKLRFLREPHRYKVLYGGRGGIKSWSIAQSLLIAGGKQDLRIPCAREIMQSIRESVHQLLEDQITRLGMKGEYEVQKAEIRHRHRNTSFTFHGLRDQSVHNIKSLEGADILWVEEAQNVSKKSWRTVIPTIRKPGSEIWVSFNPELETDDTYQRFVVNPPPNAVVVKTSFRDNPALSEELKIEIEHLKATDPDEYECV